jgi:hypothetical protein
VSAAAFASCPSSTDVLDDARRTGDAGQIELLYDELARLCRLQAVRPADDELAKELRDSLARLRALQDAEARQIEAEWRLHHPVPRVLEEDALFQAAREAANVGSSSDDRSTSDSDEEDA